MPIHPLEPLSALEVQKAVQLLKSLAAFTHTMRIISISLREPDKSFIYEWTWGAGY